MFLIDHFKFLFDGGLNPATADTTVLRARRSISTTIFLVVPLTIGLIISNYYTGGERDNLYIAIATAIVFLSLYVQAYLNQQLLASQIPMFCFWIVICLAMMTVGVWGNTWGWLLCLPAVGSLIGRIVGLIWALISVITLWVFACLQYNGYEFAFAPSMNGPEPLAVALEVTLVLVMLTTVNFVFRSGQINAERKLNANVHQLEQEVHERTLAENEARQSEQAKASFLAAMSHELRTPLNGVIGASQLLAEGQLPSKKQELVEVILHSSESLIEVINNVLDLSRLDANTIELETIPVDLRDLLTSTLAPLGFQAREKGVKFSLVIEDDIPEFVKGDPTRLRQIILNVVGNAVKFTNTGEVSVVLDTALDRIRLKITDTGIGIPKHAQASLFEPYVQADVSTMRKFGGSGLGLSIVKGLLSAMAGKIIVNSIPGRGSTFTIFLPMQATTAPAAKPTVPSAIELPRLSIVVADDNAINRMVLSRMLEQDGHKVVAMSNGREVVDYLPDHEVNLILMDLQMPVMDGVAAVRKIRAMPGSRSTIPVIAVTANVVREQPEELLAAGMNGFLSKPFRQSELRAALQQALSADPG